jgi:hypothetical protein
MEHPLDGCFALIARAMAHQQSFDADLFAVARDPKLGATYDAKMHHKQRAVAIVCENDFLLPPHLGVIFGEVIHDLHAALDNLVFELGSRDGATPDGECRFPILNHANDWFTDDVRRALHYVRPADRARVESFQPFMPRGFEPAERNVLAQIKRYSDEGRRRVLTPIAGAAAPGILDALETNDVEITSSAPFVEQPLRKDTVVAEFGLQVTGPNPMVRVNGTIGWYAALPDRIEVRVNTWLRDAIAHVHDLMQEFRHSSFR